MSEWFHLQVIENPYSTVLNNEKIISQDRQSLDVQYKGTESISVVALLFFTLPHLEWWFHTQADSKIPAAVLGLMFKHLLERVEAISSFLFT